MKVITGQIELNETTWAQFQADLKTAGVEEYKAVYAEAYQSFMDKIDG